MLLGEKAQGPSLSPEPLQGQGLALTWGLTWGLDPPRSYPTQPADLCPTSYGPLCSTEAVEAEGIHTR